MGFVDERRIAELRYRSSRNRVLIRVIGYLTSIIPAALIAFNFEAFRQFVITSFGGQVVEQPHQVGATIPPENVQQPVNVRQQQRPGVRPAGPTRPVSEPATVRQVETTQPLIVASVAPKPVPVVAKPPQPVATFALDLTKKKQSVLLDVAPGRRLRIQTGAGSCQIAGDVSGALPLGGDFNPRAEVQLEERTEETAILITYLVDSVSGRPLPFTLPNLTGIRRRIARRASAAATAVASLEAEKSQVDAYLNSSQGKLVTTKRAAEARQAALPRLIAAAKANSTAVTAELAAIERLLAAATTASGAQVDVYID